ncbi:hypothetical protein N0V93_004493 [Gnomoniopsis smithogilvyi]|uniref:Uncharacterized protein n=1 Tax=Gnomoniopsis smithogilvyi TaxID=1191159 RepID=A0A9W8YRL0_9PEZI|nr:hypothetical protein N0V93_004493 [Gnomoniopsis smithogilvyi]
MYTLAKMFHFVRSIWFLLCLGHVVQGQFGSTADTPILLDGGLDDATVDDVSFNSGGTISVNGWTVIVPANMLVTFPNAFVPWPEFVAQKDAFIGFEVNVAGNIVNGSGAALAAQIYLLQYGLEFNQGYITAVNYDGSLQIQDGPLIRVNDPNGVFGAAAAPIPFFVADDESPSITAFSGFPMCIPRSEYDILCPLSNRPDGGIGARSFQAPDPLVAAPFLVGDFISYSGVKTSNGEIAAYEVVTENLAITTTGAPSFIRVEEALVGVYTSNTNAEIQETRFIGYTSDPNAVVSISALILDPCTGVASEQNVGVGELRPDAGGRNKFTARIDGTTAVNYAREYRLSASTGTVLTKNGFLAGQYVNPVATWVQPENLNPSLPPIPNEFSRMTHLTRGIGIDPDTGRLFGPLTPFPQSAVDIFDTSACPSVANNASRPIPIVQAAISLGDDSITSSTTTQLFVRAGDVIVLSGSQANPNINESTLTYDWGLISDASPGTTDDLSSVQLSEDNKTYSVSFSPNAPVGDYIFELNITAKSTSNSSYILPASGTTNVTITLFNGFDTVKVTAVTWTSTQSGTVGVTCTSNYWVDSVVGMTVAVPLDKATGAQIMSPTPPNSGTWAFSARSAPQPGTVVCSSRLGGFATQVGQTT